MDLALNNLQRLICHKKPTNQPTNPILSSLYFFYIYPYFSNSHSILIQILHSFIPLSLLSHSFPDFNSSFSILIIFLNLCGFFLPVWFKFFSILFFLLYSNVFLFFNILILRLFLFTIFLFFFLFLFAMIFNSCYSFIPSEARNPISCCSYFIPDQYYLVYFDKRCLLFVLYTLGRFVLKCI